MFNMRTPSCSGSLAPDIFERIWRARKLIDDCYQMPLNLQELADRACFSRYHFIRQFRRTFHLTPHQYLIQKRMERAKELLGSSELPVTEICFEVGFQSLGSFSSLFRKCVGEAPAKFRSRLKFQKTCGRLPTPVYIPGCFLQMYSVEPTSAQI